MLLCDIGNTSYHFYDLQQHFKHRVDQFDPATITQRVYFICVNQAVLKTLQHLPNWIDLEDFIDRKNYYTSMGIDRIVACESILNGVIVDAGSAITVDVVRDGVFQGGFIYPGRVAFEKSLAAISPALQTTLQSSIDFDTLPKDTNTALSYGFLSGLRKEVCSYDLPIYLTGGDATFLHPLFEDAYIDELLLFKGMEKIIQRLEV